METTSLAARTVPFLLDVSTRSLLIFALAGLAWLGLRRSSSAAARHALWTAAILALLCLPALCAWLPRWTVHVLPAPLVGQSPSAFAGGRLVMQASPPAAPAPPFTARSQPSATAVQDGLPPASAFPSAAPTAPAPTDTMPTSPVPLMPARAKPAVVAAPAAYLWLLMVWMVGVLSVASRILVGLAAARRLAGRRCRLMTSGPLVEAADQARRALGLTRPVTIREGATAAAVAVPMTFGLLRPTVLLPVGAERWPAERLRVVLLHETAHIRRMDWAAAILAQFVCALYWFHPLVWLIARRLRVEAEEACDDLVLTSGVAAPDYAAQLLEIARGLAAHRKPMTAAVTMAHGPEVAGRLRTILAENRNRGGLPRRGLILTTAATLGLLVPLAAVRPVASVPPSMSARGAMGTDGPLTIGAFLDPSRLAPMMAGRSRWDVTLSGGIRVRLLAVIITDRHDEVVSSWAPDGTPELPRNAQRAVADGAGPCQYLYGLVFPSARRQNGAVISGGGANDAEAWTEGVEPWHGGQPVGVLTGGPWHWGDQSRAALRLTVASGPGTTLIAAPPTVGARRRLSNGGTVTLSPVTVHSWRIWPRMPRRKVAMVTVTLPPRYVQNITEYSFETIGRDGKPFPMAHGFGGGIPHVSGRAAHLNFVCRASELPLNRVREFRFIYRPSHTAVFHDVALEPKAGAAAVPPTSTHEATGGGAAVRAVSWRTTMTSQYFGDWPHGWPRSESSSASHWVRRDAPAIASSGDPPRWKNLRDAHGSRARSPRGNYLLRERPSPDERNEVAYLVDQDIQNFIGLGLDSDNDPKHPWQERPTVLNGRPALLYVRHWSLPKGSVIVARVDTDVYRWIDPVTRRLIRSKGISSVERAGHPQERSVYVWNDIHYNQPPPPGVFDWSSPDEKNTEGAVSRGAVSRG